MKASPSQPVSRAAWSGLSLLTLIYVCHSVDRSVMSIVVEPVKAEFGLSDSQMGVLSGLAYAMTYAIAGIPIGYLIDRVNRRNLLAGLVATWSAFTVLCGFAQSYVQLLVARLCVGAAEAGGAPTSISIISDLFPEARRSSAISIFWLSTAIGTAVSFGIGGIVAANFGWRAAFLVAGAPGLVLAVVLLMVLREPKRGAMDVTTASPPGEDERAPSLLTAFRFAATRPPVVHTFIAMSLKSSVLSGALVWAAAYFMRTQDMPIAQAGIIVGISIAVFGGFGSLLGGVLGDWAYKKGGSKAVPLVPCISSLVTAATLAVFALTANFMLAIVAFAAFEIASRTHTAPAYSFMVGNLPARMRGVVIAALQVSTYLVGYGLGPFFVGALSDAIGGPDSIRYGLLGLAFVAVWVSIHFYLASRSTLIAPNAEPVQSPN